VAEEHERQYCALYALIGNGITQEQFDQMDRESEDLSRNVCATILFAALEVEATLNFQGAVRLGADYFNQNAERLNPYRKLVAIVEKASGSRPPDGADLHAA